MAKKKVESKEILIRKKILYYVDEISILLFTIGAVVASDALMKRAKGQQASTGDFFTDWLNLGLSIFLALGTYGSMYTKWKFNDSKKPPFPKRLSSAIIKGIGWRAAMGFVN